jgi:putative transposase
MMITNFIENPNAEDSALAVVEPPVFIAEALPALPPGVRWIATAEAASRKKITERAIRLLCERLESEGMAILSRSTDGGKPRWFIRTDADPALREIPLPADIPMDLRGLSDAQREKLHRKLAIVKGWIEACRVSSRGRLTKAEATALYIARVKADSGMELCYATLHRWQLQTRSAVGAAALIDRRVVGEGKAAANDPFLAEVQRLYLHPNRRKVKFCYRLAMQKATEQGWTVWSYRKVAQYIGDIPEAVKIQAREGEKAYTDKCETFIERDYSTLASNGQWNADHHRLDVWVRTGSRVDPRTGEVKRFHARPWLTAWQDVRSRKIVGWELFIGDPNTDNIILAFRRAIIKHGVPEAVYVDNGKDFDSYALHGRTKKERRQGRGRFDVQRINGIFAQLQVDAHNVQRYHGQSKPIERFFNTLEEQFGKLWESYCGPNTQEKPEGLQERLDAGKAPTLEELSDAFGEWLENVYHNAPHYGDAMDGKSPSQIFTENLATKRTAPESMLDVMLFKQGKPVRVTQNGVRWQGLCYGKTDAALRAMLGKDVLLSADPKDASRVAVRDTAGVFVCLAHANERLPVNADSGLVRQAISQKRRDRKTDLEAWKARPRMHETTSEIMFRMAADRQAAEAQNGTPDPLPPMTIRPIRPAQEEQLKAIHEAFEAPLLRMAAGAESMSLDAVMAAYGVGDE